jgi:hypothetical protein
MRGNLPDLVVLVFFGGLVVLAALLWFARDSVVGRGLIVAALAGLAAFFVRASAYTYGDGAMASLMLGYGVFLGVAAVLAFVALFLTRNA